MIYAGIGGFNLELICKVNLSQMTELRAVIVRPDGSRANKDIALAVIQTLTLGATLAIAVAATDFPKADYYKLQVAARDAAGASIYFKIIEFNVAALIVPDFWDA